MENRAILSTSNVMLVLPIALTLLSCLGCTEKYPHTQIQERTRERENFISAQYNHFEGGILFENVESGLNVLWNASFKNSSVYKENVGLFVSGGLLILPNRDNTHSSGRLSALRKQVKEDRLFVLHDGIWLEVFAIIHTHPRRNSLPMPTPRNDYSYCYLGIHNYVMDHENLFDAYKDSAGNECFTTLGFRGSYKLIPFVEAMTLRTASR